MIRQRKRHTNRHDDLFNQILLIEQVGLFQVWAVRKDTQSMEVLL